MYSFSKHFDTFSNQFVKWVSRSTTLTCSSNSLTSSSGVEKLIRRKWVYKVDWHNVIPANEETLLLTLHNVLKDCHGA